MRFEKIQVRLIEIPGCDPDRLAVGSTCSCSTHKPSSFQAGLSPKYSVVMLTTGSVKSSYLTSLKNFSKVHIFWGLTSRRPARIGVRCFLIPGGEG